MAYKIDDLIKDIKNFDNSLNPKVISKGKNSGIDSFTIEIDSKNGISFNFGPNLVFFMNNHPVRILKYLPMLIRKDVTKFVNDCLNLGVYDLKSPAEVKASARKYLGKEKNVVISKTNTLIEYDKFNVIVTMDRIFLIGKKTKRILMADEFDDSKKLEKVFSVIKVFAEKIEEFDK